MFGALFGIPSTLSGYGLGDLARAFAPPSVCAPYAMARPSRGSAVTLSTELFDMAWRDAAQRLAETQMRRRDLIDAALYDLGRLGKRDRLALDAAAMEEAVIVAHPEGRRPLCVYPSAEAWSMSIDAEARILSLVAPGSSPVAAAAFARQIADARGEPVLTAAPAREPFDLVLDLVAPLERLAGRAQGGGSRPDRGRIEALLEVLSRAPELRLIVSHGLGGATLADLLEAETDAARERRRPVAPAGLRVVTLGGAPALPSRFEAAHGIGAFDAFGWAISDPLETIRLIAPFSGASVHPRTPGALPLEGALEELVGELAPAQSRFSRRAAG